MRLFPCLALAVTILWGVAGCQPPAPEAAPTAMSAPVAVSPFPTPAPPPGEATGQPVASPIPLILPDGAGVTVACESNTTRLPLIIPPGVNPGAASRLAISVDALFVIADGGLYRAAKDALGAESASLTPILVPGQIVGGRPVQELTDLDIDPTSGRVVTLDKAGHVFGYDPAAEAVSLAFRATRALEQSRLSPFQFNAVVVSDTGEIRLLDSSGAAVWAVTGETGLRRLAAHDGLSTSVDMTMVGDQTYVLQRDGALRVVASASDFPVWRAGDDRALGLAITTSTHLGAPLILVVDGLARAVMGYLPGGEQVTRHVFDLPRLGLLRDAVFAGERLYALAGNELLIFPAEPDSPPCATPAASRPPPPDLVGFDVIDALEGAHWPVAAATLPDAPHAFPGASRVYRLGIHNGTDLYGYAVGAPVMAAAQGVVVEATLDYAGMSYADFQNFAYQSEKLGMTPPDILSRFEGKKIVVYHGDSVSTVYAHLDTIADGIRPGVEVQAGQLIGTVGVTGTSAESRPGTEEPHLHFEIWLGERYLGQGITVREAMWWFEQVFNPVG